MAQTNQKGSGERCSGNFARSRTIQHPEIGSAGHGWPSRIIKPTENLTVASNRISGLYDLAKPGKYPIQMVRDASGNPKEQSNIVGFVKLHPYFDPFRGNPRFAKLVHQVGLD